MELDEKFYRWENGRPGGWYKDDDGTVHELDDWDTMNKRENFEQAVKQKGEFAWFCYTHNIGTYFYKQEDRSFWLGAESHYDEDHFFFITGIPGLEDKRVAFQLRVSNHKTMHAKWEMTHSNAQKRPNLKADFCLNLVMNPCGRPSDEYNDNPAVNVKICSIDIPFDYYNKPKAEQEEIDAIIAQITNGERPTISYDKIVSLFGEGDIRSTGPGEYREHNFTDRQNQPYGRGKYFDFLSEPKTKEKEKNVAAEIPTVFSSDDIPLPNSGEFTYNGRRYYFNCDKLEVYPEKTRRGNKYFDEKSPIPVNEGTIKITRGDILEMVKKTIKILMP